MSMFHAHHALPQIGNNVASERQLHSPKRFDMLISGARSLAQLAIHSDKCSVTHAAESVGSYHPLNYYILSFDT